MKAIIVDDEAAARGLLRKRLRDFPEVQIIDEAENELEAIEKINKQRPDLIFLDIQMTVLSGFEVLLYLEKRPLVIFCTAHDHYAVRAFEENAVDYLLKPVTSERLGKSLERVRRELDRDQALKQLERLGTTLERVVCEIGNRRMIVALADILMFSKDGRYTYSLTDSMQKGIIGLTIDYLAQNIPEHMFCRISRSTIIAKRFVASYQLIDGLAEIVTTNGEKLLIVSE